MNGAGFRSVRWAIAALVIVAALLVMLRKREPAQPHSSAAIASTSEIAVGSTGTPSNRKPFSRPSPAATTAPATAEEIVAAKLKQFARSRRDVMYAMARQKNVTVPDSVERFFDAVESGDWFAIEAAMNAINGGKSNAGYEHTRSPEVTALWAPIIDAYGVAEQVHLWPAQKLLDYGNDVLGSLRPGQVYVGGTDEGRWVPTLMNETSDGERRIVITQNGLADGTYAEYLRHLYGDRFNALSNADSERAFQDYMSDAKKRLAHDQQFPDEPKQVRDNEQIQIKDGKTQVSGMVAVMDINERLLRMLMDKNPDLSFALQESFPLKGTYADAAPMGPIMELRAQDQNRFTAERAAESVNYWRNVADQLRASPDDANGETPLKSYSKLATGQANLFAERGFAESAEQTYRIALGIVPSNVDAVTGLAGLLERTGRAQDARTLVEQFARDFPKQAKDVKRFLRSGMFIYSQ
jgi:hypothetical protein